MATGVRIPRDQWREISRAAYGSHSCHFGYRTLTGFPHPNTPAPCTEAWVGLWHVHKVHSFTLELCLCVAFCQWQQETVLHTCTTLNTPGPYIGSVFTNIANSPEVGTRSFNSHGRERDPQVPGSGTDVHNHLESAGWRSMSYLVPWAISSDSCANHCSVNDWQFLQTLLRSPPLSCPCVVHYHEISEIVSQSLHLGIWHTGACSPPLTHGRPWTSYRSCVNKCNKYQPVGGLQCIEEVAHLTRHLDQDINSMKRI